MLFAVGWGKAKLTGGRFECEKLRLTLSQVQRDESTAKMRDCFRGSMPDSMDGKLRHDGTLSEHQMAIPLSHELSAALHAAGGDQLELVDPTTNRTYVLVDREVFRRALELLRGEDDLAAIARGIAQMEAGEGMSLSESRRQNREALWNISR
jgi:hypothetical protein